MRFFKEWTFVPTAIVLMAITYLSLAEDPVHTQGLHLFEGADKLVHGCMYFGLVAVGCFDLYRVRRFSRVGCWVCLAAAVAWGGLMELLQGAMTTGRSADWLDFVSNSCGAVAGLLFSFYVLPRLVAKYLSRD